MRLRHLFVTSAAVLAALVLPASTATAAEVAPEPEPVTVVLEPNGGAITGQLEFTGQRVTGTATGLDPDRRYISLAYGLASNSDPGNVLTCADPQTAVDPRAWGVSPEWEVSEDGTGTLDGTLGRPTSGVYTVSIRQVPRLAPADPYVGFNPVTYPVVACGAFGDGQPLPLPTVTNPLPLLPVQVGF